MLWIRIRIDFGRLDPNLTAKMTHKNRKNEEISCFEVLDVHSWGAVGFSCSLDILHGGVGIKKLQFLIQKRARFFLSAVNFLNFFVNKTWIRIYLKCWIRIRTHWNQYGSATLLEAIWYMCRPLFFVPVVISSPDLGCLRVKKRLQPGTHFLSNIPYFVRFCTV